MGILDTIKANWAQSPLGQAVAQIPEDTRTPEQRVKDILSQDPYAPQAPENIPVSSPAPVATQSAQAATPAQSIVASAPNMADYATAPTQATSPVDIYKASIAQGQQLANLFPSSGIGMQMGAAKKAGEIQEKAGEAQANLYEQQQQALKESQENIQRTQAEREQFMSDFDEKYNEVQKEDAGRVDFNRYYKNQSTGNQVLTALSLALSVFGGPGSTQKALGIIDNAVNKDIEAQKFDVAQKTSQKAEKLKAMDNLYARMMQKFGDKDKAEAATRGLMIDQTIAQVSALAARTNSQLAKTQAQNMIGELQNRKDDLAKNLAMNFISTQASGLPAYGQVLPAGYKPSVQQEKLFVPGFGYTASEKDKEAVQKIAEEVNPVLSNIDQLKKIYEANPNEVKSEYTEAGKQAKSALASLTANQAIMMGIKRQNEALYDVLQKQGSDITKITPSQQAAFKQFVTDTINTVNGRIAPYIRNPSAELGIKLGKLAK